MKNIEQIFSNLVPGLEEQAGGPVHLIRIIGSRWSYVSGTMPEDRPFVIPQRVAINDEWALIFYPSEGVKIDSDKIRALFL